MKNVPINEHTLRHQPASEIEHMMQTHGEIIPFVDDHIRVVREAIDSLPETMVEVLTAVFAEQVPYSLLGKRLGCSKTQAWRKAQAAIAAVASLIDIDPAIIERYNVYDNWEDAANAVVRSYDRVLPKAMLPENVEYATRRLAETVRALEEPTQNLFFLIASETVADLKDRGLWQPDAFLALLCSKQHDYGHDNINNFGLVGVAVRICDKWARLNNLMNRDPKVVGESTLDTLLDLIGYCVIAEMLINSTFNLNLKEQQ